MKNSKYKLLLLFCMLLPFSALADQSSSGESSDDDSEEKIKIASGEKKSIGFVQDEYEYRYFDYNYKNTPTGKYNGIERNWKILQNSVQLTEQTTLWIDLRRVDYLDDKSGHMKKTAWGWDHEASVMHYVGDHDFFGKNWKFYINFGWEGDWNYNRQQQLNWSSNDYYPWIDFKTVFEHGLTPWDKGKHNLSLRPLLVEYIDYGKASKFHTIEGKTGGHVDGNRTQFLSIFLTSQWSDRLSTIFTFRNYADFLAHDGLQYYIGSEDYLTYTFYKGDNGIYIDWYNKLEMYNLMKNSAETGKDRFTEFYTRLRIGYQTEFSNKMKFSIYAGKDLWDYHYNDSQWVNGDYGRSETIVAAKITMPLGLR